eukprot:gene14571-10417_t
MDEVHLPARDVPQQRGVCHATSSNLRLRHGVSAGDPIGNEIGDPALFPTLPVTVATADNWEHVAQAQGGGGWR